MTASSVPRRCAPASEDDGPRCEFVMISGMWYVVVGGGWLICAMYKCTVAALSVAPNRSGRDRGVGRGDGRDPGHVGGCCSSVIIEAGSLGGGGVC